MTQRLNARTLLFRQLQQFFEQHLVGLFRISDVKFEMPEMAPKERGRRQLHKEIVIGRFGRFTISIFSTAEVPPLGRIVCIDDRGHEIEGPIDEVTWRRIAGLIHMLMPRVEAERFSQNVY